MVYDDTRYDEREERWGNRLDKEQDKLIDMEREYKSLLKKYNKLKQDYEDLQFSIFNNEFNGQNRRINNGTK